MTEEQRQKAKEDAVLLALQNDMALIRRDLKIYGLKKDGSTIFISKSKDYDNLWADALVQLKNKKPVTMAVSGGFDPIHIGHARMFQEAKRLGDKLVVILNNDNWLQNKKGYVFMPEKERIEIIKAIAGVDNVLLTHHKKNFTDRSVCAELLELKPDIFANGGDRTKKNIPEVPLCKSINCKMVFGIGWGGKVQSSSWLAEDFLKNAKCKNCRGELDCKKCNK